MIHICPPPPPRRKKKTDFSGAELRIFLGTIAFDKACRIQNYNASDCNNISTCGYIQSLAHSLHSSMDIEYKCMH